MKRRSKIALLVALMTGVYLVILWQMEWLRFPLDRDETHFWPTTLLFSHTFVPDVNSLRSYNELNTPFAFLVFGQIEHLTGHGLVLSRYFNLALSAVIVMLIACVHGTPNRTSVTSALGLVLFPYFLGVSTHLYTDTIASLLVVGGLLLHLRGRYFPAATLWMLAISTRQYMIAFPLGVAAYELTISVSETRRLSWICPLVAVLSFGLWIAFFRNFAPAVALREQELSPAVFYYFFPEHALYFLSCIGFYYCMPEAVFDAAVPWRHWLSQWRWSGLLAGMLAVAFSASPPFSNRDFSMMGGLDRGLHFALNDQVRIMVLYFFALWALLRFVRPPSTLECWMLLGNALVMSKAHLAWDKYAMPLLCALWLMRAWKRRLEVEIVPASSAGRLRPDLQSRVPAM